MKKICVPLVAGILVLAGCSNLPPEDTSTIKAYPNPYNPTAGVLTIEKVDGSAFGSAAVNDLIVYDYNLAEIYHANVQPVDASAKKLIWGGMDNQGLRVTAGIYYVKVVNTQQTGVTNADSMFKLVIQ